MNPGEILNRAGFRAAGLQGRRTSQFIPVKIKATIHPDLDGGVVPEGHWQGRAIGSFLSRLPVISNVPAAIRRHEARSRRLLKQEPVHLPGASRVKRTAQRVRASA